MDSSMTGECRLPRQPLHQQQPAAIAERLLPATLLICWRVQRASLAPAADSPHTPARRACCWSSAAGPVPMVQRLPLVQRQARCAGL